ncbi:NUDIX domain-containing protein [Baia soyae]|nr:NUDIX domain-containing protein [Baia soyae]
METNQQSAGMIVFSIINSTFLLVQHKEGHWGFPKGGIEDGETELEAAWRELQEETQIACNGILNPNKYRFVEKYEFLSTKGERIKKDTIYYVAFTCDTQITLNHNELVDAKWMTLDEIESLSVFYSRNLLPPLYEIVHSEIVIKLDSSLKQVKFPISSTSIQGSKHAFSRIAPLFFLFDSLEVINTPGTIDTIAIRQLLTYSKQQKGSPISIPRSITDLSRSIINCIPALLALHPIITFHNPQGCQIGNRKIDLYLEVMREFGARWVTHPDGMVEVNACTLHPTSIYLPFPSFTGTSTALILASIAKGQTRIQNASIEPEILEMVEVLQNLGVDITFQSERNLIVQNSGVTTPVRWKLSEDRNVLITRALLALITGNEFVHTSQRSLYLAPFIDILERMNIPFSYTPHTLHIPPTSLQRLHPINIVCGHSPRACSDWHPLIAPLLCKINGESSIKDRVFEDRYRYIEQIQHVNPRFSYRTDNDQLWIQGNEKQSKVATDAQSLDLRSAAANIIALVGENSQTRVWGIQQLLRGYENILADLESVGINYVTFELSDSE